MTVDPVTGAQYWDGELNASTTMVCSDGSSAAGTGTVLDLAAEVDGYTYPTLAEAVELSLIHISYPRGRRRFSAADSSTCAFPRAR